MQWSSTGSDPFPEKDLTNLGNAATLRNVMGCAGVPWAHEHPPHTPGYSRRSHEIAPFHVMSLLARAQALEQAGHDVIHLEIGEPDFTTAEPVVRAGQPHRRPHPPPPRAPAGPAPGDQRFLPQPLWAGCRSRTHPGHPGWVRALLLASSLLVDPGRHWLLADPGYPCNRHFLRLVEGGAQLVPVGPDTAYQ